MTNQTYTPRPQIYAVFPSNKIGLFIEDCTNLKKPKIRIAIVPTNQGNGEPVEFFFDLAPARVFFGDLALLGRLQDDALFKKIKNQKGEEIRVFDLFAKIGENGHRALTVSNMQDGVYLKINKKIGESSKQGAALDSFQARTMGQAVSAYIAQIDLLQLATPAPLASTESPASSGIDETSQDEKDGYGNGQQDNDFPG